VILRTVSNVTSHASAQGDARVARSKNRPDQCCTQVYSTHMRHAEPRVPSTSIALEIVLYFGWWYDVAFWLAMVGLLLYKGATRLH
jgi:hypothetical protein